MRACVFWCVEQVHGADEHLRACAGALPQNAAHLVGLRRAAHEAPKGHFDPPHVRPSTAGIHFEGLDC